MRLVRGILLLALATFCTACTGSPLGSQGGGGGPELRRNLALWERSAPRSYEFVISGSCECLPEWIAPAKAQVFDRQTTNFRYVGSGQPVDWPRFLELSTVDELFAFIDDAYDRGAEVVRVEYDPTWGFPREVYVDYRSEMADDEFSFSVRDFARLPEPL